jgi:hypothetical protein
VEYPITIHCAYCANKFYQSSHSKDYCEHLECDFSRWNMIHLQMVASRRCYQMANLLKSFTDYLNYEETVSAVQQIAQCGANTIDVDIFMQL